MSWSASWARGVRLVGPLSDESSWQARSPGGLTSAQFRLDWAQQVASCPQGQRSRSWSRHDNADGQPVVDIKFAQPVCAACPSMNGVPAVRRAAPSNSVSTMMPSWRRAKSNRRRRSNRHTPSVRASRAPYRKPCVRMAHAKRGTSVWLRQYLQALLTAIAVNLKRAALWLMAKSRSPTRAPSLACLVPQLVA